MTFAMWLSAIEREKKEKRKRKKVKRRPSLHRTPAYQNNVPSGVVQNIAFRTLPPAMNYTIQRCAASPNAVEVWFLKPFPNTKWCVKNRGCCCCCCCRCCYCCRGGGEGSGGHLVHAVVHLEMDPWEGRWRAPQFHCCCSYFYFFIFFICYSSTCIAGRRLRMIYFHVCSRGGRWVWRIDTGDSCHIAKKSITTSSFFKCSFGVLAGLNVLWHSQNLVKVQNRGSKYFFCSNGFVFLTLI